MSCAEILAEIRIFSSELGTAVRANDAGPTKYVKPSFQRINDRGSCLRR